ncbi:hypothetical protein [Owenweeksia hongkongensis]|uniref:hypothetical protein n=1 Tax=Owenweeksia hongkongensis TaxID=253245 RepID=UPI003A8E39A7
MNIRGYILSIVLGILGFCATLFGLFHLSIENATLDEALIITDGTRYSTPTSIDTLCLYKNELLLTRRELQEVNENFEVEDKNVFSYSELSFNINPHYLLWMMIIAIGLGLSFASLPVLHYYRTQSSSSLNRRDIRTCLVLSLLTIVLILGIAQFSAQDRIVSTVGVLQATNILFQYPGWVLGGISALSLIPNFICLVGNYCIVTDVFKNEEGYGITKLLDIHRIYSKFLVTASLFLGFGVISSHYLRLSVLDIMPEGATYLLPQQYVVVYSLVFTFFLILLYLPGEVLLTSKINAKKLGLSEEVKKNIGETISKQSILKTGLSLLGPALIGLILEVFKLSA